ncbi:MAG: FAD-binding protein, partial [Clostridiales bacterium]
MTYDIVIIGAGPAGSTLARLLSEKYSVLIVDKRDLDNSSIHKSNLKKSCGGLLSPDTQKILSTLGLGLPEEILTGPQMFSVKTIDFDNLIERHYQRHYININREKFDKWLVSLIGKNTDLKMNCFFKKYFLKNGLIKVKLRSNGNDFYVNTKILIGADGSLSLIRNEAFKCSPKTDEYISIEESYTADSTIPYFISIFDKDITDFYSWIIQKQNYLLLGTAIPKKENINEKFKLLKDKLNDKGFNFQKVHTRTGTLILRPRKIKQISLVNNENIALVGEASGLISPSSADGISYALKSAICLADSINLDFDNFQNLYKKKSLKLKLNILEKNIKLPFIYNSNLRKII